MQRNTPMSRRQLHLAADMLVSMFSPKLLALMNCFTATVQPYMMDQHDGDRREHLTRTFQMHHAHVILCAAGD